MTIQLPQYFDPTLSGTDRRLLDKHLSGYLKLLDGQVDANTDARRHFIKVARGDELPLTAHEAAFVRWQVMVGWRPNSCGRKAKPLAGTKPLTDFVSAASSQGFRAAAAVASWAKLPANSAAHSIAGWYSAFLATDAATQLDRWMRDNLTSDATIYDKALDASYALTHEGGALHRLFDGAHDLAGAWQAVAAAADDDPLVNEVAGYLSALWNDMATPMGLPIVTLDKAAFDAINLDLSAQLGIGKGWLADSVSFTASEALGASLGALALCLNWNNEDVSRMAILAGTLLPTTILAANPLLLVVAVVALGRAYTLAKSGSDFAGLVAGISQGDVGSAAFLVAAASISGPAWVSVVAGVVAYCAGMKGAALAGSKLRDVDWTSLAKNVASRFSDPAPDNTQSEIIYLSAQTAAD